MMNILLLVQHHHYFHFLPHSLTRLYIYKVLSNCLLGKSKLKRSSSVAPAGKLTRRDSENKLEMKVTGEGRILMRLNYILQASILESEYTSSASGTD